VQYENEEADYYDLIVAEALEKAPAHPDRYDAILVDEGQDFSDDMLRLVTTLLNPVTDSLTIALDESQNIYRRKMSWKAAGVKARGRVHRIDYVYRNTCEIARFAAAFVGSRGEPDIATSKQLELFPGDFDFHGPAPRIERFPDWPAVIGFVSETIRDLECQKICPLSEIAILYGSKTPGGNWTGPSLPERLRDALEMEGVLSRWAAESVAAKRAYDITTNSVTISTIHTVKGLDFAIVFLLGLDSLDSKRWTADQIYSLVYDVGITRARYQVFVPYIQTTALINRLKGPHNGRL
jgi:superfamily I DNA/RNA helicase